MNKIFWGLLFLFFDFNINGISILPAFVGYLLIYFGMKECNREYDAISAYAKARPWAIVATVWSAVFWLPLLDLGYILSAVGMVLRLVVTYFIVEGVEQLEHTQGTNMNSARLRTAWYVTLVCSIVIYLMGIALSGLAVVAMIVWAVAAVVYLVAFYKSKKALEY